MDLSVRIPHLTNPAYDYRTDGIQNYSFDYESTFETMLSYKLYFQDKKWKLQPIVALRSLLESPMQYEGHLLAEWNETVSASVGYRDSEAIVFTMGANYGNLKVSYAYEMSGGELWSQSSGTHEIMLAYHFRTVNQQDLKELEELKKQQEAMQQQIDSIVQANDSIYNTQDSINKAQDSINRAQQEQLDDLQRQLDEMQDGNNRIQEQNDSILNLRNDDIRYVERDTTTNKQVIQDLLEHGYYVVIYSYKQLEYAQRAIEMLAEKGEQADVAYNKDRGWYYVYSDIFQDLQPALDRSMVQRTRGYTGSWVYVY